jgi:hypothetical protein
VEKLELVLTQYVGSFDHYFIGGKMEFLLRCRFEISKIQMTQIFKVSITDHKVGSFSDIIAVKSIFGIENFYFTKVNPQMNAKERDSPGF